MNTQESKTECLKSWSFYCTFYVVITLYFMLGDLALHMHEKYELNEIMATHEIIIYQTAWFVMFVNYYLALRLGRQWSQNIPSSFWSILMCIVSISCQSYFIHTNRGIFDKFFLQLSFLPGYIVTFFLLEIVPNITHGVFITFPFIGCFLLLSPFLMFN